MAAETRAALQSSSPTIQRFTTSVNTHGADELGKAKVKSEYDNKSARGGKGGKVLSVASNWAEIVGADEIKYSRSYPNLPLPRIGIPPTLVAKDGKENGTEAEKKPGDRILTKPISTPKGSAAKPFVNETIGKPTITQYRSSTYDELVPIPPTSLPPTLALKKAGLNTTVLKKASSLSSPRLAKPFVNDTIGQKPILSTTASISRSFNATTESIKTEIGVAEVASGKQARNGEVNGRVKALVGLFK